MSVIKSLRLLKSTIPDDVKLVAVSKTKPIEDIKKLYSDGCKIFGENKVQELVTKYELLPKDIEWHMIGHMQRNKVKYIAPFVSLIHSVDSLRLLEEINKRAKNNERIIDCLFECHIAKEDSKFGLKKNELFELLENEEFKAMENVRITGLMGMATFTDSNVQIASEFKYLKSIFDIAKAKYFADKDYFKELSMGMSNDYKLAIEEGATIVRVGSLIFGKRQYIK